MSSITHACGSITPIASRANVFRTGTTSQQPSTPTPTDIAAFLARRGDTGCLGGRPLILACPVPGRLEEGRSPMCFQAGTCAGCTGHSARGTVVATSGATGRIVTSRRTGPTPTYTVEFAAQPGATLTVIGLSGGGWGGGHVLMMMQFTR